MAFDSKEITLDDEGTKRTFLISKMSAFKAEKFIIKAGLILGKGASNIEDIKEAKDLISAICNIDYEKAEPLLDELLDVVSYKNEKYTSPIRDNLDLISSPLTLLKLRVESAKYNFGFFFDGSTLNSLL